MSYYSLSFSTATEHTPMPVRIIRVNPDDHAAPRKAVEALQAGGILIFPIAEGYIVGCSATDETARRRLCEVTGVAQRDLRCLAASREQAARLSMPVSISVDPIPLALMRAADLALAVTTCRPGQAPAPTAQHVVFILGDSIDLVLDAGAARPLMAAAVR